MAVRVISTRLAISGEKEYRDAIALINKQMSTMKSELALVESKYRSNANSMQALNEKASTLGDTYKKQQDRVSTLKAALDNAKSAQEQYAEKIETLRGKLAAAESQQEQLKNSTGDTTEEQKKLTDEITSLNKELQDTEARELAASKGVEGWQKQLNEANVGLNDLDDEIQKNNQYLEEAKNSADGCATSIDKYGNTVTEAKENTQDFGTKGSAAAEQLAQAFLALGVAKTLKEITAAMKECIEASIAFQSAFAGVEKTVDGTDEQLQKISDGIQEMSLTIPATTTEIAAIAEVAGQLGIKTEDVLAFTRVMINLGTSTNMTAEDAATMIAQFANITRLDTSKYENLASAIVALGNNYATTESKITDMAQNMASAATIAGLSEPDILALSTAVSSLGIEAQAGGSAMSKLISKLQSAVETGDGLEEFAQVANMSAEEFEEAWGENAVSALNAFIQGLNDTERNGASALVVLNDMDIKEVRLRNAVLSLANAGDLLNNTLDTANTAFEENNALQTEASKRYATTESKVDLYKNSVSALEVAVGDTLTPALEDLAEAGADINTGIAEYIEKNPGVVKLLTAVTAGLAVLTVGVVGYTAATKLASAAQAAFNAMAEANPYVLIATAAAAAITAISVLVVTMDSSIESIHDLTDAARDASKEIETINTIYEDTVAKTDAAASLAKNYVTRLEELEAQGLDTAESQSEYANIVALLNTLIPDLNLVISEQTGLVENGTEAVRDNIQAWKESAYQQAYQTKYNDLIGTQAEIELELEENQIKRTKTEEKLKSLEKERTAIIEAINKRTKELTDTAVEQSEALGMSVDANLDYDETLQDLNQQLEDVTYAIGDQEIQQGNLADAINIGKDALSEHEEEMALAEEAVRNLTSATEDSSNANANAVDSTNSVSTAVEELITAYEDAYESAYENINNQIGLFDSLSSKSKIKVNDLIKTLQGQTSYMYEYAANIQRAMELGVDEGIIEKLSDGSEESAQYLAAIVAGGEEKVGELNEAFAGVEEGKEVFADAVATMETDFDATMDQLVEDAQEMAEELSLYDEAKDSGEDTAQGYIDGVNAKQAQYKAAMTSLAKAGQTAYKNALNQHSPSKATMRDAEDTVQGYILGAGNKKTAFEAEMGLLAKSGTESFNEEIKKVQSTIDRSVPRDLGVNVRNSDNQITQEDITHLVDLSNSKTAGKLDQMIEILSRYLPEFSNLQMVTDTGALVGAIAPSMDKELGKIKTKKERGQ